MGRLVLAAFEIVVIFTVGILLIGFAQWVIKKLNTKDDKK